MAHCKCHALNQTGTDNKQFAMLVNMNEAHTSTWYGGCLKAMEAQIYCEKLCFDRVWM